MKKTWNDKQQIQFELARDMLSSYSAQLSRVAFKMLDKKLDEVEIEKIQTRAAEITKEKKYFDGFDEEKVANVINTYSELMREFDEEYPLEELAAEKGIASKYLETKAFYNDEPNKYQGASMVKDALTDVMSQYTHVIWDEKKKNNPNLEEIKRLENKHDKYATILFDFSSVRPADYENLCVNLNKVFKENKQKIKEGIKL